MRGSQGRTDEGFWQLVPGAPSRRLGPGVLSYRGFRLDLNRPERRIEFASGMITMVVNIGGQVRIGPVDTGAAKGSSGAGPAMSGATGAGATGAAPSGAGAYGAKAAARSFASLVNGPRSEATMGEHGGRVEGVEIHLAPWMAYTLLGTDMADVRGLMLPLSDVLGSLSGELEERLAGTPQWSDRFAVLDALLGQRQSEGRTPAPQVIWAWSELIRSDGLVPLSRLSAVTGWSARHIELRFRQQIGLSPKTASRVLRIQRALRMLTAGAAPSAAAAACGFYDQAHLHRDFKTMTGCTPGEFRLRRAAVKRPVDRMPGRVTSALVR
ncbi:helix-turn-helix domain-containing protein [Streptomyces sp. NPDC020917]|uniref:helix-turn-helix domain-containing protein n=1 Tax=Streptomyces sp. NPDC020917 TaxID=3365102 RepID=UPI0037979C8C